MLRNGRGAKMPSYCYSCQHCKTEVNTVHAEIYTVCCYNFNGANDIQILPWNYDFTDCPRYIARG